jgi:RNA polymerase sigma factor (sigma-70 family)
MQEQIIMSKVALDKTKYRVLGPLLTQLRFESPETLLEQSYRAEHLIRLLDPAKGYPYDFVCYKLTNFKPKLAQTPAILDGENLICDLATFIEQVTKQKPINSDRLPEPVRPVRDIADDNDISIKTLSRWTRLGLAQRQVIFPDQTCQNVILESTWQWFITKHESRVARAAAFSRLSPNQRQTIVRQARQLYQKDNLSRYQIEIELAEKNGRARETIRFILNAHDRHAAAAERIFPDKAKLTDEVRRQIFEMAARGLPVGQLARIFGRSSSTIYRIINEARQEQWQTIEIGYIYSPDFDLPSADQTILPGAETEIQFKPDSDNHIQPLSSSEERGLFRAYNYLKWKQDQKRKLYTERKKSAIPAAVMDRLESLQARIDEIKGKLILANQALVISIAKKHLSGALSLDELASEGLTPLMKAVEKFDYTKGFKFSTYASWAVMKHFARIVPLAGQQQHHYLADEELDRIVPGVSEIDENHAYERSMAVINAMDTLDDRERHILKNRFGLDRSEDPMSLAQLGKRLGVTKERVRQIESKAMDKLHTLLKDSLPSDQNDFE